MGAFCCAKILEKQRKAMKQVKTYNFIEITKKEFQQYQSEPITTVQAIEIQNNLFGVVDLLLKWSSENNAITQNI